MRNINMKTDITEGNMYIDDSIVIEDEFSASVDSHDQKFYQQLVSESLSNDAVVCESPITSEYDLPKYQTLQTVDIDVKEEYIESDDSTTREFYLQLINESAEQDCEPIITREYDSLKHIIDCDPAEEELDVGSVADNSLAVLPTFPTAGGIKSRLRVRRPARTSSTSSSGDHTSRRKTKSKHKQDKTIVKSNRRPSKADVYHRSLFFSEIEPLVRREHNDKERQRRGDLRHLFDELRVLVPATAGDARASKVLILGHASTYCSHLRAEFQARQALVLELCQQQKRLRRRVDKLCREAMPPR